MEQRQRVKVLGVKQYNFADRETGEKFEGTTVWYIAEQAPESENVKGNIPQKANLPYEHFARFNKLPGEYDMLIKIDFTGARPTMKVVGFEPVVAVGNK
jgi:hypothetical protein